MCIQAIPAYGIDASVPTTTIRSGSTLLFRAKKVSLRTDHPSEANRQSTDVRCDLTPKYGMHCTPSNVKSPRFLQPPSIENTPHCTFFSAEIVVTAHDTPQGGTGFYVGKRRALIHPPRVLDADAFDCAAAFAKCLVTIAGDGKVSAMKSCRASAAGRNPTAPATGSFEH